MRHGARQRGYSDLNLAVFANSTLAMNFVLNACRSCKLLSNQWNRCSAWCNAAWCSAKGIFRSEPCGFRKFDIGDELRLERLPVLQIAFKPMESVFSLVQCGMVLGKGDIPI